MPLNTDTIRAGASGAGVSAFYTTTIDQSLRFEDGDSANLYKNFSASNRKTNTFSFWVKRGNLSSNYIIFSGGAGSSQNDYWCKFASNDTLEFRNITSNSYNIHVNTSSVFRDTTNWYHILLSVDTTQATSTDRVKIYVNGEQQTLTFTITPAQDSSLAVNYAGNLYIGRLSYSAIQYFDGYIAEFNFIDGTQLDPTSFGESKNGVWIPKAISGLTYGTNGFRLTFADSSALGDDTSGNTNDFTASGLTATDVVLDSPTNNFATALGAGLAEPVDYQSYNTPTSSEGNLKVTGNNLGWTNGSSNFGMTSGKWYAELIVNSWVSSIYVRIGLRARPARTYDEYFVLGNGTGQLDATTRNGRLPSFTTGDVIQFALDLENNAFYLGKNGTWGNSATKAEIEAGTTTNAFASGSEVPINDGHAYFFYAQPHSTGTTITWNFGQDSSFAGATTAGTASDSGSSNTNFKYTPPTGFLGCNAINLPELTLSPNQTEQATDYFNTITYSGDGQTTHDVTGVGFKPDWTWIKERQDDGSHIASHVLLDSSRGYENYLVSNATNAEGTGVSNNNSTRSNDGFQTNNSGATNQSGQPYVAWNWKANGGTTSSNTVGTITSTVQSSDKGFSIVTYTSNNSAGSTVGHGLTVDGISVAPKMVIIKKRSASERWFVWHTGDSAEYMYLNETFEGQANLDDRFGNNTTVTLPSSTLLTLGTHNDVNGTSGSTYVAYCFAEVEGFSKFGSYTGNSSADGTFIYTGFRPAYIMVKKTTGADDWIIHDNARSPFNVVNGLLEANTSDEEFSDDSCDFVSNGFKWRLNSGARNTSGQTYIYMAFSHGQNFKFGNAR